MGTPENKNKTCDNCENGGSDQLRERIWEQFRGQRKLILNEEITPAVIEKIVMMIFQCNQEDDETEMAFAGCGCLPGADYKREPLTIYINSIGGLVDESFSVISAIEASKTPVHTVVLGKACSGAFMIALSGHKRSCQKYSRFMYHQGSGGYIGKFADIVEYADEYSKVQEMIHDYVIRNSRITMDDIIQNFMRKHDWYMNSEEALELGGGG